MATSDALVQFQESILLWHNDSITPYYAIFNLLHITCNLNSHVKMSTLHTPTQIRAALL